MNHSGLYRTSELYNKLNLNKGKELVLECKLRIAVLYRLRYKVYKHS